jgi:hypothetical protein
MFSHSLSLVGHCVNIIDLNLLVAFHYFANDTKRTGVIEQLLGKSQMSDVTCLEMQMT